MLRRPRRHENRRGGVPAIFFLCLLISALTWGCRGLRTSGTPSDGVAADAQGEVDAELSPILACGAPEFTAQADAWLAALTASVSPQPTAGVVLAEESNGVLTLGLRPEILPLLASPQGVHAAALMTPGGGRVVAFSGQDFLSSGDRSTLLDGQDDVVALLRNAVAWSGGDAAEGLRVLVDNDAIATALGAAHDVAVTPVTEIQGLREIRDWSAEALRDQDVIVVQVNEWGTLHVDDAGVEAIRDFIDGGGGLIIAGSAMHWRWWLSDQSPEFPGDAILGDVGVRWSPVAVHDLSDAQLTTDTASTPDRLWCAYVTGDAIEDAERAQLAGLFSGAIEADRLDEVDVALQRLLAETPALPVSSSDAGARLSADVAVSLRTDRWPSAHPWAATFPGDVTEDATRIGLSAQIDATWKRDHPLGAYAAGGDVVTVAVPAEHAASGLVLRLGEAYDDLRSIDDVAEWRRAPALRQDTAVVTTTTVVGNGLGGALYLVIPEGYPDVVIPVEVQGAVPMAVFTHGEDDAEARFADDLAQGAPQAILQRKGKVRMVVPSAAASEVTDAGAVLEFWGGFYDSHADLAQEPVARPFESHWIFDPQVGWGYANATGERITFPDLAVGWALRTQTGDEDWWLFGHELGHQFQTEDWSGGDITEVAVNLFTMFTLNAYINDGGDLETRGHQDNAIDHAALESARWASADLFGKLELYRQLVFEFGWDAFRQAFASYHDAAFTREAHGSFMDGFAIRFSLIVDRDLTPFLDHWEYPMSDAARTSIQGLGLTPWLPPGW